MHDTEMPSLGTRGRFRGFLVVVGAGAYSAGLAMLGHLLPGSSMWDAAQLYLGAKALWANLDPYEVVRTRLPYPLFYPLPAVLLFAPLSVLPPVAARMMWGAAQGAALGYAGLRRDTLLVGMLSAGFLDAVMLGQWSPFLAAAAVVPALGCVFSAKPTIGAALFLAFPRRTAAIGSALVLAISLVLVRSWPGEWLQAVQDQIHLPAIMRPGDALLLLALLRWRRPERRMLAVLACVPQTTSLYETLSLFLIPRRRREAYLLAALTLLAAFLHSRLFPWHQGAGDPLEANLAARWPITLFLVYLPALMMLLRVDSTIKR